MVATLTMAANNGGCGCGVDACVDAAHGILRAYVDRGKGQVAQWSAVVAVALWRLLWLGWHSRPRLCVSIHAAWVVVCGAPGCVAVEGENVGLLRCDCALWNRGHDSVCAPPCGVHWMDGWVTGLAATADERRRTMAGCGRGVHACADAAHGILQDVRRPGEGAGGPAERSGGRSAVAVVCGWGPRGCVGAFCAA